jgi:hypothetical protein
MFFTNTQISLTNKFRKTINKEQEKATQYKGYVRIWGLTEIEKDLNEALTISISTADEEQSDQRMWKLIEYF